MSYWLPQYRMKHIAYVDGSVVSSNVLKYQTLTGLFFSKHWRFHVGRTIYIGSARELDHGMAGVTAVITATSFLPSCDKRTLCLYANVTVADGDIICIRKLLFWESLYRSVLGFLRLI